MTRHAVGAPVQVKHGRDWYPAKIVTILESDPDGYDYEIKWDSSRTKERIKAEEIVELSRKRRRVVASASADATSSANAAEGPSRQRWDAPQNGTGGEGRGGRASAASARSNASQGGRGSTASARPSASTNADSVDSIGASSNTSGSRNIAPTESSERPNASRGSTRSGSASRQNAGRTTDGRAGGPSARSTAAGGGHGGRASRMTRSEILRFKPLYVAGDQVMAAWWPDHDPDRNTEATYHPAEVAYCHEHDGVRYYALNYIDGQKLFDVEDFHVWIMDEYSLGDLDECLGKNPHIRNIRIKNSRDIWSREVGFYEYSVGGETKQCSFLSEAIAAVKAYEKRKRKEDGESVSSDSSDSSSDTDDDQDESSSSDSSSDNTMSDDLSVASHNVSTAEGSAVGSTGGGGQDVSFGSDVEDNAEDVRRANDASGSLVGSTGGGGQDVSFGSDVEASGRASVGRANGAIGSTNVASAESVGQANDALSEDGSNRPTSQSGSGDTIGGAVSSQSNTSNVPTARRSATINMGMAECLIQNWPHCVKFLPLAGTVGVQSFEGLPDRTAALLPILRRKLPPSCKEGISFKEFVADAKGERGHRITEWPAPVVFRRLKTLQDAGYVSLEERYVSLEENCEDDSSGDAAPTDVVITASTLFYQLDRRMRPRDVVQQGHESIDDGLWEDRDDESEAGKEVPYQVLTNQMTPLTLEKTKVSRKLAYWRALPFMQDNPDFSALQALVDCAGTDYEVASSVMASVKKGQKLLAKKRSIESKIAEVQQDIDELASRHDEYPFWRAKTKAACVLCGARHQCHGCRTCEERVCYECWPDYTHGGDVAPRQRVHGRDGPCFDLPSFAFSVLPPSSEATNEETGLEVALANGAGSESSIVRLQIEQAREQRVERNRIIASVATTESDYYWKFDLGRMPRNNKRLVTTCLAQLLEEGEENFVPPQLFLTPFSNISWRSDRAGWVAELDGKEFGIFSNIFDAVIAREDEITRRSDDEIDVSRFERSTINRATLLQLQSVEEERIRNGESVTSCIYPNCIRGKNVDCGGFCSMHHASTSGSLLYDDFLAIGLEAAGLPLAATGAGLRLPGQVSTAHSPDHQLAYVRYPEPDEAGKLGHIVVIANDGGKKSAHDNSRTIYSTRKEFNNMDSMFAVARDANFHLLLYRHYYPFTERQPSPLTMEMLTSLCHQADEDARPGASTVVYSYRNRHSIEAEEQYADGNEVQVRFVELERKSTWRMGFPRVP